MPKLQKLILVYEPEIYEGEMAQLRTTLPVTADTVCEAQQVGSKFTLRYEVCPAKNVVREWHHPQEQENKTLRKEILQEAADAMKIYFRENDVIGKEIFSIVLEVETAILGLENNKNA